MLYLNDEKDDEVILQVVRQGLKEKFAWGEYFKLSCPDHRRGRRKNRIGRSSTDRSIREKERIAPVQPKKEKRKRVKGSEGEAAKTKNRRNRRRRNR